MIFNEENQIEVLRAQMLLFTTLLKCLSDKDPTLQSRILMELETAEKALPKLRVEFRQELSDTISHARSILQS